MIDLLIVVNKILAVGAVALQVFVVVAVIYCFTPLRKDIFGDFFAKNGLKMAFAMALVASCGSLFYSNYAGFNPCPLCWFQRVFMYPQVIILGLALIKKDEKIVDYGLAMSVVGLVISAYHNFVYFSAVHSVVCTTAETCMTPYVTEFGYVTIPVMALTAFAVITLILGAKKYYDRKI